MKTFKCKACKLIKDVSQMSASRPNFCKPDVASFKSLSQRWQTVRSLRKWWQSKDEDGQAQWYIKQQQLGHGVKRSYEDVLHEEASVNTAGHEKRERDWFKPWALYKQDGMAGGKSLTELEQAWQHAIEHRTADAMYVRGEWCVCQFMGVVADKVQGHFAEGRSIRQKRVDSAEELETLRAGTQHSLDQWMAAIPNRRSVDTADTAPVVDAAPGDFVSAPAPPALMDSAITREVWIFKKI